MRFIFLLGCLTILPILSIAQNQCLALKENLTSGDLESVLSQAEKFKNSSNVPCLNLLGEAFLRKGNNVQAQSFFEKALALAKDKSTDKADALNNLGLVYWNTGNEYLGRDHLYQALSIRQNEYGELHEKTAASYNDLGLIFSASDLDQSLEYYEKALSVYQQIKGDYREKIAQLKLNIGVIYRQLELYGDAIVNFNDSKAIWRQVHPEGHPNEGFAYINLGITNYEMGFKDKAMDYYSDALDIYLKYYGNKHPEVAYTYFLIGNIYHGQEEFDKALEYYQKALISNSREFSNTQPELNPEVDEVYNTHTLLSTLYAKAQAYMDRSMYFTLSFNDLKSSLELLYACDQLIDYLRIQANNEADKIALGNSAAQVYETGALLCHYMANEAFNSAPYLEQSFYFAEKSKSAVLLEAIADASAKSFANIPDLLLEREKEFTSNIAYFEQIIAKKPEPEKEKEYRTELFKLKQDYTTFVEKLELEYPKYFDLKYNVKVPGIGELQKNLDEESALISYFLINASSRLLVYEITDDDFDVYIISLDEEFHKNMIGLRNAIRYQVFDLFEQTSQELYKKLFPFSLSKEIRKVIIIPNDKIGTIPFDALLTKKSRSKEEDYSELPYLVKDYSITYQYSAALYYQNKVEESSKIYPKTVLLCAPVHFAKAPDLPATSEEIAQLNEIFTSKAHFPKKYLESTASEAMIKNEKLDQYGYLHFATHGYVDEVNPELSRSLLYNDEKNGEDGNLYSGEIYNLQLSAKLVTLSACETGLGKISKGEGIIGLSRAFTYAGAENVLVSLWIVSDASTSKLMIEFYNHIDQNNHSKALRNAQLSLIEDPEFSKPYYWASFILIGQ